MLCPNNIFYNILLVFYRIKDIIISQVRLITVTAQWGLCLGFVKKNLGKYLRVKSSPCYTQAHNLASQNIQEDALCMNKDSLLNV